MVWADDVLSGVKELESRVDTVIAQYREAGVDDEQENEELQERSRWGGLGPFFAKVLLVFLTVSSVLAMLSLAIVLPVTYFTPMFQHPGEVLIKLADRIDSTPPQSVDLLKQAIRKIATKLVPLMEAAKMPEAPVAKSAGQPNGEASLCPPSKGH